MAEDTVDRAAVVAGLERKDCPTKNLRIHGWLKNVDRNSHLFVYGSDIVNIRELIEEHPTWEERLHPDYPYMKAEVIWAVRHEMARTVEDVLSRRIRFLLLDAKTSKDAAPMVAKLLADELTKNENWQEEKIKG